MCEVVKVLERELENSGLIFPQPDDGRSCIGTICHG